MTPNDNFTNTLKKSAVTDYFLTIKDNFFDEIDLEEFEFKEGVFYYPCPCGDRFEISLEELKDGEEVASCPSCTLIIKVLYDEEILKKF